MYSAVLFCQQMIKIFLCYTLHNNVCCWHHPSPPSTNLISSIWSIWIFYRLYESFLEKRLLFSKLTIFIVYFCNAFYISFFDSRVSMTNIFYFHFRKFILTLNLSKAQGKWWKLKSDILCRKRGISVDWRIKGIEENYV